jgi:outer membrane receptor protein involved in Fe transport
VGDVAAQIPGLSTTNLGLGRDKILLRGLSDGVFTGRTQSTVGIYLDDVPITYNAPDPDLQLADIEAIEVLRGPQGSLYGGGAMSGVYRIVTRKPELDRWAGYGRIGGSLTQLGAPSQEYEGMLNAPVIPGRLAARAVAYETVEGGYIDATDLRLSNVDKTTRKGARGALRGDVGNGWIVNASLGFQSIDAQDAQYVTPGAGRLHRANQILESSRNNFAQTAISAERSQSWGQFKSTTSFVQHKFSSQSDASNALPLFGAGTASVGSFEEPIDIQMLTEDAVFVSPNTGPLQWLAGVYGSATWETTDGLVRAGGQNTLTSSGSGSTAQTLYSEHRTDQRDAAAIYGETSYAVTDRITLTGGLRLSSSNAQTTSDVAAPAQKKKRLYSGQTAAAGVTPKLALSYKAAPGATLYALASEGGRGPGLNTAGPIGTVFLTGTGAGVHRQFGSDKLWNFETGAKLSMLDGRLSLNADVFYDLWRNIQTDQFLSSGLSYTANAGDGRNVGAEIELAARPLSGLTLQATALLNNPVLTHADPGFLSGVTLPGVPDVSLGGRAAYRWRVIDGVTALVSAEAQYIGRSHLTFNPSSSPSMGGYILSRLSAQVQDGDWRLAFFLSNPSNARGNTFSYGNPFNFQQAQEITPERPRTLRAVLSKAF